jgi:glutamine transport system substrate-binding protein
MISIVVKRTNAKLKQKLKINFIEVENFIDLFNALKTNKDNACAISALTITKERSKSYDFSYPYMPIKEVILTTKSSNRNDWKKQGTTIALVKGSVAENHYSVFKNKYKLNVILIDYKTYKTIHTEINNRKIDFFVTDIAQTWTDKNIRLVSDFDEAKLSYYGIMYPKGSKLKKLLDPAIKSLIHSPSFLNLLKKNYGQKIVDYYREVSKSLADYKIEL